MKLNFLRKLRLLDYLIIIAVILAGIILFKFIFPKEQWISTTVAVKNASIFETDSLHKGDIEDDPSGKKIAEISTIEVSNSISNTQNITSNKDLFINIKLLVTINSKTGNFEYKNKIITIGAPIQLALRSAVVSGEVIAVEGIKDNYPTQTKILTLKMYLQWPWFADSLKVGAAETDQDGNKIVELIDKNVAPAEITVTTATGETLKNTDPRKIDITFQVRVRIRRSPYGFLFQRYTLLRIGDAIDLNLGKTLVNNALIVNIE